MRRAGNGPAAPQVRGGGPDEVLVLVDGFPVNDPLTGRADLSRISSREVDAVTLAARRADGARRQPRGRRRAPGRDPTRRPARGRPRGPAATARSGSGSAARPERLTASASAERPGGRFPLHGAGGAGRRRERRAGTPAASSRPARSPSRGRSRWCCAEPLRPRASPARRPIRPCTHAPRIARCSWVRGPRAGCTRPRRCSGCEARATDPAPPTGAAYDAYTHGVGATAELGYRVPAALAGWRGTAGRRRRGPRLSFRAATASAPTPRSRRRRIKRTPASQPRRVQRVVRRAGGPARRLDRLHHSARERARSTAAGSAADRVTLGVGSGVTPPVLADLFFREGVGVRLNPDLRARAGALGGGGGPAPRARRRLELGIRLFAGQVADMIIWAPDFRFIWSPRNFDVVRRGGELTVGWRARAQPPGQRQRDVQRRYLRHPRRRPGAVSPSGHRTTPSVVWSPGAMDCRPALAPHRPALSEQRRAPTRARPSPSSTSALERRLGAGLGAPRRGARPHRPARRVSRRLSDAWSNRHPHPHPGGSMMRRHSLRRPVGRHRPGAGLLPTPTRRSPIRRRCCSR